MKVKKGTLQYLLISMGVKNNALLNSGARVGITTKSKWIGWGKLALCKTRMGLELAIGNFEEPMGLLENVVAESNMNTFLPLWILRRIQITNSY